MATNKARLLKVSNVIKPKYDRPTPIPILMVTQSGDIIIEINGVEVSTDKKSQADAQRRIDEHPRNDNGVPSVVVVIVAREENR